jgi:hypothetical protein
MKLTIAIISLTIAHSLTVSSAFAHQWCWTSNQNNTYGWQLMTPDERKAHQAKLVSFTEYNACKEYLDKHQKGMEERARNKGVDLRVMQDSPCDAMKARGILK